MPQSLLHGNGKRFFCREWVFAKVLHYLENVRNESQNLDTSQVPNQNGILVVGNAGSGKTAVCVEIVAPTSGHGKQWALRKRLLAYHFCQANDSDSTSVAEFITRLVVQLCDSPLIQGYRETLALDKSRRALESASRDPDLSFREAVLTPLLGINKPKHVYFLLVDSIDESNYVSPTTCHKQSTKADKTASTIYQLLANNSDLFPSWLIPVYTARKMCKSSGYTSTFRRICLDDLRKSQVLV